MCTVTYLPLNNGFVLTSSRDEKNYRPTLAPQFYNNQQLIYPKDEIANGTWICYSNSKRIACLLNGGFEKHDKMPNYRKSRGLVLLECFEYKTIEEFTNTLNLDSIEPFTLLIIDFINQFKFTELIWDGSQKYIKEVNQKEARIWSSVTLYDYDTRQLRIRWFKDWLIKNRDEDQFNIFQFHNVHNKDYQSESIKMRREGSLETVSISQIYISSDNSYFSYYDFKNDLCTQVLQ